jgi:Icc-related predicted phosphoesterase
LVGDEDLSMAIMLFHAPPYQTKLDRAALDGKFIDHVPIDVHVGSIAIRRLIESRHPLVTLHGHVHESTRLTGSWMERIGRTCCFSAAHDGPELAVVVFDPERLETAARILL